MSAEKVYILLNGIPPEIISRIGNEAIKYAFFSLPFTVNRMQIQQPEQRLLNIFKGKVAEGIFLEFLKCQQFIADSSTCETPYFQPDRRDFMLNDYEWDLKNNFVNTDQLLYVAKNELPALVPDRYQGDQWSKRLQLASAKSKGLIYVFTFMPQYASEKIPLLQCFIDEDQKKTINMMCDHWNNQHPLSAPYSETELNTLFFNKRKPEACYKFQNQPTMLITAIAGLNQWNLFKCQKPQSFANGLIKTKIQNRFCPVNDLPDFHRFFKKQLKQIHWGKLITKC